MNDFLKRMLIGLTTGNIIVYYGELVFWATPEREGMTVGSNRSRIGVSGLFLGYAAAA